MAPGFGSRSLQTKRALWLSRLVAIRQSGGSQPLENYAFLKSAREDMTGGNQSQRLLLTIIVNFRRCYRWRIQLTSATVKLVFASEERDVYGYERTHHSVAPLQGAKPGSVTNAEADKGGCAPAGFRSKERTASYKHLAPMWGQKTNMFYCPSKLNRRI